MTENWEDLADKEVIEWPSLKQAAKVAKPSPKPQAVPVTNDGNPWGGAQSLKFMTPYDAQPEFDSSTDSQTTTTNGGANNAKTLADREKEYAAARKRILGDGQPPSPQPQPQNSPKTASKQ